VGKAEITGVICKGKACGKLRPTNLVDTVPRPPCPNCGETAIEVGVTIMSGVVATASVEAALEPEVQERTWERRWQDAQVHLNRLLASRSEPLDADAIHVAHADLQAFYIQTYHLKDSLKDASATTGISPQAIEDEITNNSDLALLADLANLDKHFRLSKKPRSDDTPKIVGVRGITRTGESSPEGWRLGVVIEHKGQRLDGRDIAKRSIAAWHDALQRWHLL
jgi:hypothetical protein